MFAIAKGILKVYDVLTLPLFSLAQRPWMNVNEARKVRGRQLHASDPESSWIREGRDFESLASEHSTMAEYLKEAFKQHSTKNCLGFRAVLDEEGKKQADGKLMWKRTLAPEYTWFTYSEVDKIIDRVMQGFYEVGIRQGDVVTIFMETRMEWIVSFIALNRMGAVVATLHSTLGEDGIIHGANFVEGNVIVTSASLLNVLRSVTPKLEHLKTVVYVQSVSKAEQNEVEELEKSLRVYSWQKIEDLGDKNTMPEGSTYQQKGEDIVLIMFTSGSTGIPKGVTVSNKALLGGQKAIHCETSHFSSDEVYIGYLPLAHIFELSCELAIIGVGYSIGYSSPFTLTDTSPGLKSGCKGDALVLKPTVMSAVPLVFDRVKKSIMDKLRQRGEKFAEFFEYAVNYKSKWMVRGYSTPLLDHILFQKIRAAFGGNLKHLCMGGAPLSPETQMFMETVFGAKILQGYGLTETLGPACGLHPKDNSFGRVGSPLADFHFKLVPWPEGLYYPTDKPNPRGEIHLGGTAIASGYYKDKKLTEESFYEEDGLRWLKTGDIGEMFPDGVLKIIDRAKDLVKLGNGEFISLGKVEGILKNNEYVENVCVYAYATGNYVIALISPNSTKLSQLMNKLTNSNEDELKSLCDNANINNLVLKSVQRTAKDAGLSKCETPQEVLLCSDEWSPSSGMLTGAMKISRKRIYEFYGTAIQQLCSEKVGN